MIPLPTTPYLILASAVLTLGGGYYAGSKIEHARHVSREAAAAQRIEAARVKFQAAFDAIATRAVQDTQVQRETFTEIRHVAGPIIYRNVSVCVPATDRPGWLLDRARDAANGVATSEPSGDATPAPDLPPQR